MKSMEKIREDRDFERAVERYNSCNSNRWKNAWWNIVTEIWIKTTKWAQLYILDPVKKIVKAVLSKEERDNFCYWIELLDSGHKRVYSKIGTSKDPLKRWNQILKEKYCTMWDIVSYEIKGLWNCHQEKAEGLESYFRAMCIKEYGSDYFEPNDRFLCELDKEKMNKWADEYLPAEPLA